MELRQRQRILDLYHQCSLSGLDVTLNLWYRGGQEFFTLTNSPFPLSRESPSSGWNQEKQKTQTQNRNLRRRIKRRKEILWPINGTPGAVSSAVPDLGAGSCTAEAPRVVLSKERTPREGFSQLGSKRTGAGQGAVSYGAGTPRAGSTGLGTPRGDLPGSRALRPVFPRAFRTHRPGFSKEGPSFSKLKTPGAGSSIVGAPGDGSSTVGDPGGGSCTVGAPGAGFSTVGAPGAGSSTVGAPGAGSSTVGATGAGSFTVGAPGDGSSTVRAPGAGSSTVEAPGAGDSTVGVPGEDSSVVGASISVGFPIRGELCDVIFPRESLIPQLDGSDPSPKSNSNPIFHGSNKSTTEPNLAPSSSSYSMFGYCSSDKCKLCPKRTRAKVGDFYACFVSTDSSTKGCDLVHAHSRTNLCLIDSENIYKS